MRAAIVTVFCLAATQAYGATKFATFGRRTVRIRDDVGAGESAGTSVPGYKFDMPVDHFSTSDKRTYSNRYWVNDTYYKAGGPVILFDNGEAAFDDDSVSATLAETGSKSLPMRLAANLSGIVIGWEHRYYGYSRPVELYEKNGYPHGLAKGYKYLSVEQALADVAFFANNFNKTKLALNNNVQSTTGLDPYNTPWIFIGGSYPGARAAWMRVKYPDVIYASWSSSAPLQYQEDGSPYYEPIMRSMPTNCTNDIKAAIKYVDKVFDSGSSEELDLVNAGVFMTTDGATLDNIADAESTSAFDTAQQLASVFSLADGFQSYGPQKTTQIMCNFMQSFDADQYGKDVGKSSSLKSQVAAMIKNPGDKKPTATGIAAAAGGEDGGARAFAALIYGIYSANEAYAKFLESIAGSGSGNGLTTDIDTASWNWQTISETGIFQGSNPDNITCVSKQYNITAVQQIGYFKESFASFEQSTLPQHIDNKGLLEMGGWNMSVSNVMFTNGEFDPWSAFSVASKLADGPNRKIGQKIPACNTAPAGQDVFGLVYPGAVHAEDLSESPYSGASPVNGLTPLEQGMNLFLEAWKVWQPCFNQSRDSVRNGKGPDGKGTSSGKNPKESAAHLSTMSFAGCLCAVALAVVAIF